MTSDRLDQAQIEKLSQLAKLEIDADLAGPLTDSINGILTLVDQLAAVDTIGVEPLANPCDALQILRTDSVSEANQREALQANAPDTENGLFLVPKVIE